MGRAGSSEKKSEKKVKKNVCDRGLTDDFRKDFEDVSLNMVTVLLWVQQLLPNLMQLGESVCGNMSMRNCSSYSCSSALPVVLIIPGLTKLESPELGW